MNNTDLQTLRSSIDAIDEEIIGTLARRFAITREVGELKARETLAPVDAIREARQQERYAQLAAINHLSPALVGDIFRLVFSEVIREHREVCLNHQRGSA